MMNEHKSMCWSNSSKQRASNGQNAIATKNGDKRVTHTDQTLTLTLRLKPDETVALYACLCSALEHGVEQSNKVSAVRRRLGDMLASMMHRTAELDKLLKIVERLTKGMQAEAYIKSQERKIESLRGDVNTFVNNSVDHECKGNDSKKEEALQSPVCTLKLDEELPSSVCTLEPEEDYESAREYPRRTALPPPPPVVPHLGRRRRANRR